MSPELRRRVTTVLAAHYGIPADALDRPGTSLCPVEPEHWDDWLELIPVGARVGLEVPPALRERVAALAAAHPADHVLTGADFVAAWGSEGARVGHMKVYMLDEAAFRPFTPDARYTVRALTKADRAGFDAFQARCLPEERAEADISVDQAAPYGVLDGARLVAAASTYLWLGLVDVGVLTDPEYRQQGLGKAVVSAVAEHVTAQGGILCYRHALNNTGSQGVAEGLHLSLYGTLEAVRPIEKRP